jgi:hypothetical protein
MNTRLLVSEILAFVLVSMLTAASVDAQGVTSKADLDKPLY